MIDFTKISVPNHYAHTLLRHPELSFERNVNEDTAEIRTTDPRRAEYKGMKITIFGSGDITLSGSWHKYYHGQNCEDFNFTQFCSAVKDFCSLFELDPEDLKLWHIEVGANITPPYTSKKTIDHFVCFGSGKPFSPMRSNHGSSIGIECGMTEYKIKVYSKGKQYKLPEQILRIEQKIVCSKYLRRHRINTLSDLLKIEVWYYLIEVFTDSLQKICVHEPTLNVNKLNNSDQLFITRARIPQEWKHWTPKKRNYNRNRLTAIIETHATGNLKNELIVLITNKLSALIPSESHKIKKHTRISSHVTCSRQKTPRTKIKSETTNSGYVFPHKFNFSKISKWVSFTTSIKYGKHNPSVNLQEVNHVAKCVTCGRDISTQKKGSRFCSEKLLGKAAKKCRNEDSNPRNNSARAIAKIESQPLLFDHRPFIKKCINF